MIMYNANTKRTITNPNMQRMGDKNGRWNLGKSAGYRRALMKAPRGTIVHHKNGNKADNRRGNFEVLKPNNNISAIGKHNKLHPEKGSAKKRRYSL